MTDDITSRDKFIAIMSALTFDDNWKRYLNEEIHLFMNLIHDYGHCYTETDDNILPWLALIDEFSEKEEDLINVVYNSLTTFY